MGEFILIIVLQGIGYYSLSTITQEFRSKESCEKAKTIIVSSIDTGNVKIRSSGCYIK